MPFDDQGASDVIAYVTRYMACEGCQSSYRPEDIRVMLHHDGQWGLLATCPACRAEQHVTAYDEPPYTKLRLPDVVPAEITPETVAGWANFLSGFDGDMYDLLASQ
jgi:hypothetical protein